MLVPLTCTVTKQQLVGGGQCSRRDWMARLISTAAGKITKKGLEIWMATFGSDWTKFTAWQKLKANFEWISRTSKKKTAYAEYSHFAITDESSKYKLSLGTYSGNYIDWKWSSGKSLIKAQINANDFDVKEINTHHRDTTSPTYSEVCNNHTAIPK